VTIMFRGREITYAQHGRKLLDRVAKDSVTFATVEREPRLEGRNMFMILSPRQEASAAGGARAGAKTVAAAAGDTRV